MASDRPHPQRLLQELTSLQDAARLERLRTLPDAEEVLLDLADEAARTAFAASGQGLLATEAVLNLADKAGQPSARVRARMARALALAHAGRLDESIGIAKEGAELGDAHGALVDAARCRLASMHPLTKQGRLNDAVAIGERARQRLAELGEPALAARADVNLANVHKARGDGSAAILHLDRAIALLADDPLLRAQIANTRGNVLLLLDRFDDAERAHVEALDLLESLQLAGAAAVVEGNLADLHARCGRLQAAMRHFERALARLDGLGDDRHRVRLLVEQCDAIETLGLPQEALEGYERSIERLTSLGFIAERARAFAGRSRCLLRLRRIDEAIDGLRTARELYASLDEKAAARVDLLLAETLMAQGRVEEARLALAGAFAALPAAGLDRTVALVLRARLGGSIADADEAVASARNSKIPTLVAHVLSGRARLHREADRLDAAIADLEEAASAVERVRGTLQAERFRAAFLSQHLALYDDLVRSVLDRGDDGAAARAFAIVERAKSRALLDIVKGAIDLAEAAPALDDRSEALRVRLSRLRAELNALYSQIDADGHSNQRLAPVAWSDAVADRETELERIESRLAELHGHTDLFAPTIDAERARSLLDEGTTLVEYFVIGDELIAFRLCRDEMSVYRRLANTAELSDAVGRVQFQMRRAIRPDASPLGIAPRLVADARRELHNLYETVLGPLCDRRDDFSRLVVIPHGPLHLVPFAALFDGERHLTQRGEIVVAPSASLLDHGTQRSVTSLGRSALVAACGDMAAPRIIDEGRAIAKSLIDHGAECRTLLDTEATVEGVLEHIAGADIVHLACHGRFLPALPRASGLRLADRWMTVRDIYGLRLRASLVTLSGCDTGRNLVTGGDEILGLVRGFLAAGAKALLVSLWSVNDAATADFMGRFYSAWHDSSGGSPAAALHRVQREAARAGVHPAFWAPFVLVGEVK